MKVDARSKNRFEVPSPPPKSEVFLENFSEFSQNQSFWSSGISFDHFTQLTPNFGLSGAKLMVRN